MKEALLFLANAVFSFFTILFLLRFFMQVLRVSFIGPLGQFVMTMTNWAVRPLRRIIPAWRSFDLASLVPAYLLQVVWAALVYYLAPRFLLLDQASLAIFLSWHALLGLIRQALNLLFYALILQAILSWVNPQSPLATPLHQLTRFCLDPIRRIVPPISGIDLSPLIALLAIQALLMLL